MYLIDTNIISEQRKGKRANEGVQKFFSQAIANETPLYLSSIMMGELRRGVALIRHRGDIEQAKSLEAWLTLILEEYKEQVLDFGIDESQVWGALRVPHYKNALDKQIAATALTYDLILVTRNVSDFESTGVRLLNPFDGF